MAAPVSEAMADQRLLISEHVTSIRENARGLSISAFRDDNREAIEAMQNTLCQSYGAM